MAIDQGQPGPETACQQVASAAVTTALRVAFPRDPSTHPPHPGSRHLLTRQE